MEPIHQAYPRRSSFYHCGWIFSRLVPKAHRRLKLAQEVSLAVKLGYKPTDRILIVNADDVGMSYAANQATIQGMEKGLITAGSIMVPCP